MQNLSVIGTHLPIGDFCHQPFASFTCTPMTGVICTYTYIYITYYKITPKDPQRLVTGCYIIWLFLALPRKNKAGHRLWLVWGSPKSTPTEVVKKKPYKSAILLFTLSFLFSSLSFYRLSAFHHNQADLKRFMHMRQPLRNYLGPTCWTQLKICFPSLGGISMAEWSVGDGVWSWFSGNFCYRFCYRFVIVLCHVDSPNPWSVGHTSSWSIHTNARGASAAAS